MTSAPAKSRELQQATLDENKAEAFAQKNLHCMTVSLAQDGDGLGAMWGQEKARAMLNDAGFNHVADLL